MRTVELLRAEPRARIFFAVLTQSSLGTGAAYIALLLIAYQRYRSAWAVSLVLIADLAPAMLLGPLFGAVADRWSRRGCMVVADLLRAGAFLGIALVDSFEATIVLAAVAGMGTGLFTPASLAALPSLVATKRLPAASSVYGVIADLGFTAGPAIAAVVFLFGGPEAILVANAVTFVISAVVLVRLRYGAVPPPVAELLPEPTSLLREAKEGLIVLSRMNGLRVIVSTCAVGLFFGGLFNVAELPFARGELGAGAAGFSLLAMAYGLGFVGGSLAGARGGAPPELKRHFLLGLMLMSAGFLGSGLAPVYATALFTFTVAGVGNGLVLIYERLLIQASVPDRLMARIFGAKDALTAWAFGTAFIAAGGIISLLGTRALLIAAGCGGLIAWAISSIALRQIWRPDAPAAERTPETSLAGNSRSLRERAASQNGPNVVSDGEHWLALLDDLGEARNDIGVELRPGVHE